MIILHISPINMHAANGLRFSVPGLASSQTKVENTKVAVMNILGEESIVESEADSFDFDFFANPVSISKLPASFNNPDIVVFHGVYYKKYLSIAKELKNKNIPYVITPRVSLTKEAQEQKKTKKMIANLLFFKKFISSAASIHYLNQSECQKSVKFNKNNFIAGNGITPTSINKTYNDSIIITFIGRYDVHHKGLDILLESLPKVKELFIRKNVKVNLYGSDYSNGKKFLFDKRKEFALEDILTVNDAIYDNEKEKILTSTDIFIAPSRFEGHPMAVIEAMSYGIPCILSEGTNMLDVLKSYKAGWATSMSSANLSKVLIEAISTTSEIIDRGMNAKKLVLEKYTWKQIADLTVKEYSNILKKD